MSDDIIDLAELVKDAINGAPSLGFTAVRGYLPDLKKQAGAAGVKVFVIPKSETGQPTTREDEQVDWEIYVGIIKKLAKGTKDTFDEAELDGLRSLVSAIKQRIRAAHFECFKRIRTLNDPLYDPEHLDEQRQFTSILSITYRGLQ